MAKFVGGPCDGRDTGANFNATISCGGISYTRGAGGDYYPDTAGSGPVGVSALGPHAPKGWAAVQRAVNHKLPSTLRRTQAVRRATLRTINRRHRLS